MQYPNDNQICKPRPKQKHMDFMGKRRTIYWWNIIIGARVL